MVTVDTVLELLEGWAPGEIAWERDNAGLQYGSRGSRVRGILVALDPTEATVAEARKRHADLIVTHHPLLFRPLRVVSSDTASGRTLEALIRHLVNLVSAHTNLDFAAGGTSHALAERLGLREMRFLRTSYQLQKKLVTFVPAAAVETVARAMATAGAGVLGNYEECSFRVNGTGTFRGGEHTQPVVGRPGRLERVPEIRLEMVVPGPAVDRVVSALKATHPYEEVAYDIYPTENRSNEYGMGVIGTLQPPASLRSFLGSVRKTLGIPHLRFCRGRSTMVRRVAVCGGNGGDLLDDAVRQDADAFVTADVSYHRFHEASGRIVLIDAGHCETESPVVTSLAERLRTAFHDRGERVRVTAATVSTNPIQHV